MTREVLRRFADDPCYRDSRAVLFDIDDASGGLDPTQGDAAGLVSEKRRARLGARELGPLRDGPAPCDP